MGFFGPSLSVIRRLVYLPIVLFFYKWLKWFIYVLASLFQNHRSKRHLVDSVFTRENARVKALLGKNKKCWKTISLFAFSLLSSYSRMNEMFTAQHRYCPKRPQQFNSYYYTFNSLSPFWLAESVRWIPVTS